MRRILKYNINKPLMTLDEILAVVYDLCGVAPQLAGNSALAQMECFF